MKETIDLKIDFFDLDPMNIVWHGNYLKFFEKARCAFLKKLNFTYTDMAKNNFAFPIVSFEIKYIKPCVFEQEIRVTCELESYDNFLKFNYLIFDKNTNEKICKAKSSQMAINLKTNETLFEIPQILKDKIYENSK